MNLAECRRLIDDYVAWIKRGIGVNELAGSFEITTPFLDRHNDAIAIYAESVGAGIRLTDDGYTISDLKHSGFEISTDKRRSLLTSILNGFGVKVERDTLYVDASERDFPQKKHNLLQAIMSINDMFALAEEHVVSFFKEDVAAFLATHDFASVPDIKLAGKTGLDHRFDFALPRRRSRPERVVRALNVLDKHNTTDYAFAVTDIRSIRPDALGAIAVINDLRLPPSEDNLSALRAYDIEPILWSHREDSAAAFNGA